MANTGRADFCLGRAGGPALRPVNPGQGVTPIDVSFLVNFVGVTLHPGTAPYTTDGIVKLLAGDPAIAGDTGLGVLHTRYRMFGDNTQGRMQLDLAKKLWAKGIKSGGPFGSILTTDGGGVPAAGDVGSPESITQFVNDNFPEGCLDFAGGTNEPNVYANPATYVIDARNHLIRLAAAIAGAGKAWLRATPVASPPLGRKQNYEDLGNVAAYTQRGDIHLYQQASPPSISLLTVMKSAHKYNTPNQPLQATESGYHNALQAKDQGWATSERAAGIYEPIKVLEFFLQSVFNGVPNGMLMVDTYQLYDEGAYPGNQTDKQKAYGMVRYDGTRKPSFIAVGNLMRLLRGGTGATPPPLRKLDVALAGGTPADLAPTVLVQRPDGSYLYLLWRRVSVWNRDDPTNPSSDLTPDPLPVSVKFGGLVNVTQYQPSTSANPIKAQSVGGGTGGATFDVSMGGELVCLLIRPSAGS